MQPHGVVVVNEAFDKPSGILLAKRATRSDAISFEALGPSLDFTITLRVIGRGLDIGKAGQTDKLLKVLGDKLGTVVGDDPWGSSRRFFPGSLQDDLDVELRHRGAQFPMQQETRTAIQDRAEIKEGAGNVQIRDIHMPVLVGLKGLLEAVTLARSFRVPTLQEPSAFEYPISAGG